MARVCVRVCSYYYPEAKAALRELGRSDVVLKVIKAPCERPPAQQAALARALQAQAAAAPMIWFGSCLGLAAPEAPAAEHRAGGHCLALLAGPALVTHLVHDRAYLVSPGWLADWRGRLNRWGFDQPTARLFFGEFADRVVLLDTGVAPAAAAQLPALAEHLGLAAETLPVGLEHFRLRLERALAAHPAARPGASAGQAEAHRQSAEYAMALDLLGELARLRSEAEVIEQIRQVVEMLLGPRAVRYVRLPEAGPAPADDPLSAWLSTTETDWTWNETEDGFRLRLVYQGQVVGGLQADGLAFPDRRQHYLDVMLGLAPLCALAVANARAYERLGTAEKQLRAHAAQLEQRVIDRTSRLMQAVADLEQEVTARRRLSEALQETVDNLETVFRETPLAIVITSAATGRILKVNEGLENLLGYPRAALLGRSTLELGLYVQPDERAALLQTFETERVVRGVEVQLRHRDGRPIIGLLSGAVIQYNGEASLLSMVADITDRKAAESLLRETQAILALRVTELEDRARELTELARLVGRLQQAATPAEAYAVIAAQAGALFPDEAGGFWLAPTPAAALQPVARWGPAGTAETAGSAAWCSACPALESSQRWLESGLEVSPACRHHLAGGAAGLCLPVSVQDGAVGVLHLRPPAERLAVRRPLAAALAEQIGLTLSNLRLRDELRERAAHDPLTGLYNRLYMQEALERELHRAGRQGRSVSILMFDLDHFKRFNDQFGHLAGDDLLRRLAQLLRASVRGADIICRYGGEEFLAILPDAGLDSAAARAEQWRAAVSQLALPAGADWPVTVSIGVACWPQHGPSLDALIDAADRALYQAKTSGRNQVALAA